MNTINHSQPGVAVKTGGAIHSQLTRRTASFRAAFRMAVLAFGLLALLATPLAAQTNYWIGGDSSWFLPGNWSLSTVPVAGQEAWITNGGTARVADSLNNGTASVGLLRIGNASMTTGSVVVADGGALTATRINVGEGANGVGNLTVADSGVATVGGLGIFLGARGTLNIGNGGAPGKILADGILGAAGTSTVIFNHNSTNFVFTHDGTPASFLYPRLNGDLRVIHNAGVTVLGLQSHSYHGQTDVNGGSLVLGGVLFNPSLPLPNYMLVDGGATIGGSGSYVGEIFLANQSILSPGGAGPSVGTLLASSFSFSPDVTWQCDMADAASVPGVGWDQIYPQELFLSGNPANPIRIALRSLDGAVPGPAANFNGLFAKKWAIATLRPLDDGIPGQIYSFAPENFVIDTTEFANPIYDGQFRLEQGTYTNGDPVINLVYERPSVDSLLAGDRVQGTSTNSPLSEGAANATDNVIGTKYLNFDKLNSGLILHPYGVRPVTGLTLVSANDNPERDPASFRFEGSDDGTNFTVIASGPVPPFAARHAIQTVRFDNSATFPVYRLIFPTVVNQFTANSMQIAEVELLSAGEITSTNDVVSITLPPGATATYGLAPLFDRMVDGTSRLQVVFPPGGDTVVDIVPAAGPTVLKGFEIIGWEGDLGLPGDPNPPRSTPSSITVQGSNDGTNFTTLSAVSPVDPVANLQVQEFATFPNSTAFPRYRVIFGPQMFGNLMIVGELRLFGDLSVPSLSVRPSGNNVLVSWPETPGFVLETKAELNNAAWSPVGIAPVLSNGVNTVTVPMNATTGFFRLRK